MDLTALQPRADLLLAAVALDALIGDPRYAAHPIRLVGRSLDWLEARLRSWGADGRIGGCLLFCALGALWLAVTAGIVVLASRVHVSLEAATHTYFVFSLVALGDLLKHGRAVDEAAADGDLGRSRAAVKQLVGRDTDRIDGAACRRAAIESLAENLVDGFVSPILWYGLCGLPGIVLFKVVSTMDSMVGYKTTRYLKFGWCGARLDDLLNLVPARLTWLLMSGVSLVLRGCSARKAARIGWQQHARVPGPNSGWSEAAMAGAIQRRLAGPIWLDGRQVTNVWLGHPSDPEAGSAADYRAATRVVEWAAGAGLILVVTGLVMSGRIFAGE